MIEDTLQKYPAHVQMRVLKNLLAEEYKASLFKTSKHLLGYADINPYTHGDMISVLEAPTKRKLIVMPRGTFKSTVAVVGFSIWCLMSNPNHRILIDSEIYNNSKNFLREIKAHLETERLSRLFGEFKSQNWNEGEITIKQRTKTYKEASITCGGIGTTKVGQHYSIIIGDDLNSGNNSNTSEMRKKVIQHFQMNTAILEPDGIYVIIGTRYATDDVIGHILDNEVNKKGLI